MRRLIVTATLLLAAAACGSDAGNPSDSAGRSEQSGATSAPTTAVAGDGAIEPSEGVESEVAGSALPYEVEASYRLPGVPFGGAMDSEDSGYLSLYPDTIVRFELPREPDGDLTVEPVASGLQFPRAIAIAGDVLYTIQLGSLLCDDPTVSFCFVTDTRVPEDEIATLAQSSAEVWAFPINGDGTLGEGSPIVTNLPVVNNQHAPNGLLAGEDGRLYITIGNLDQLATMPERAAESGRSDLDLLGTVVSFNTDGSDLQVMARGLRNPYDIAWGPDGALYTADNDGPSLAGYRAEEVLRITEGDDFGFPYEGTYDAGGERTSPPLWVREVVGSAAVEWGEALGLGPGLFMSAFGVVDFLPLNFSQGLPQVDSGGEAVRRLVEPDGVATVIETLPGERLLITPVAFFGAGGFIEIIAPAQ